MNYRYKRSWLRMCSEKEAGRLEIDWSIDIGRFLGDTGRPNAFEDELRSTILEFQINYYNMRLMLIFSLWTSKLCATFKTCQILEVL